MAIARQHLQRQRKHWNDGRMLNAEFLAWASLCHALLNTNEFMYVD
jgi:hypothetical protein